MKKIKALLMISLIISLVLISSIGLAESCSVPDIGGLMSVEPVAQQF